MAYLICSPYVAQQIVVYVVCHALLEVIYWVGSVVADSEVSIFVRVAEVIRAVLIIYANHRWHEQGINETVCYSSRERR